MAQINRVLEARPAGTLRDHLDDATDSGARPAERLDSAAGEA